MRILDQAKVGIDVLRRTPGLSGNLRVILSRDGYERLLRELRRSPGFLEGNKEGMEGCVAIYKGIPIFVVDQLEDGQSCTVQSLKAGLPKNHGLDGVQLGQ